VSTKKNTSEHPREKRFEQGLPGIHQTAGAKWLGKNDRSDIGMNVRMVSVVGALTAAFTLMLAAPGVSASVITTAPAASPAALPCHAFMSNSHPRDFTTTDVRVSTRRHARVTTVAHYKTVNRRHTGTANAAGRVSIPYHISGATPGRRVSVSVSVRFGNRRGSCSTAFTPHR
jgi:hypothetical protein